MTDLEALDNLHRCVLCGFHTTPKYEWQAHCRKVRDIAEADLRILDLIKRKRVDVDCISRDSGTARDYNQHHDFGLDEEEYKKIKEWLER